MMMNTTITQLQELRMAGMALGLQEQLGQAGMSSMSFEERKTRVPVDRVIREDLHSVCRVVSSNGSVSYRAPRSADGHADRATAKALAHRAANRMATECRAVMITDDD